MDNPSILYRIQQVLEFYAKGEGYDKDNGFLAKSLLKILMILINNIIYK